MERIGIGLGSNETTLATSCWSDGGGRRGWGCF